MARTDIDIDDDLVKQAMQMYRLSTKQEAIELALRRLVETPLSREEALAMKGSGWDAELGEVRRPDRSVET